MLPADPLRVSLEKNILVHGTTSDARACVVIPATLKQIHPLNEFLLMLLTWHICSFEYINQESTISIMMLRNRSLFCGLYLFEDHGKLSGL